MKIRSQEDNMKKAIAQIVIVGLTVITFAGPVLAGCGCGPLIHRFRYNYNKLR